MADKGKRPYWLDDDDDGRTIADMSGVRRRNILIPHRIDEDEVVAPMAEAKKERPKNRVVEQDGRIMDEAEAAHFRPWEERSYEEMSARETRQAILGALTSGLILVGTFIAAGGLLIGLMIWAWT